MDEIIGWMDLDRIVNALLDHYVHAIYPKPVYVWKDDQSHLYWENLWLTLHRQFIRSMEKKISAAEKTMKPISIRTSRRIKTQKENLLCVTTYELLLVSDR